YPCLFSFYFTHPSPSLISTLSLHDALPILVDFAGSGVVAAGNVGDVDEADKIDVFLEFFDEIAFGDLLVEEIVEKLDVRIAGGTDNVKTFCGAGQKIFGIFFRVDVFNEQLDLVFGGDIGTALKRFDAVGVHLLRREAGNLVAGLHDEARAVQFAHGGNEIAKGLEKSFTLGSVRKRKPHAAGAIELHAQLMLFAARFGKVRRLPILEFPDQLDGVIAGFGNLFETLRKREIAVDGPEHHGEGERNAFVLCGRVPWQCGGSCGSTTGG